MTPTKTNMLDASAVLASLFNEPGYATVTAMLADVDQTNLITSVNASEVIYKLMSKGLPEQDAVEAFEALNLKYVSIDYTIGRNAASIWPETRSIGASMGDRLCMAAAIHLNAVAVTTDKSWQKLKMKNLHVMCIR